jgi:hypothetical protein
MPRGSLASLLTVLMVASAWPAGRAARAPTDENQRTSAGNDGEVADAIRKLSDPSFQVREKAQRALLKFGQAAEKLLEDAANSTDAEVAKRAKVVLAELNNRQLEAQVGRLTFDDLLARVHRAAASEEWQKPGWKDSLLDAGLNALIDQVKRATKNDALRLPVGFGDVQPRSEREIRGFVQGGLCVLKEGSIAHARRSIFLVDGSLRISHAQDCVIVARGAVDIAHGRGNVVLAGHYLHTSHDGGPPTSSGSVLMSGSILDVSHSNQSVCYAPRAVSVSFATGTIFLNSPKVEIAHEKSCTRIDAKLPLAPTERKNPLSDKIKITQIVRPSDSGRGALVVLDQGGVEVVVRPGAQITDRQGKVIPEAAGWKLSFAADGFALFSKDREDAGFYRKRQP